MDMEPRIQRPNCKVTGGFLLLGGWAQYGVRVVQGSPGTIPGLPGTVATILWGDSHHPYFPKQAAEPWECASQLRPLDKQQGWPGNQDWPQIMCPGAERWWDSLWGLWFNLKLERFWCVLCVPGVSICGCFSGIMATWDSNLFLCLVFHPNLNNRTWVTHEDWQRINSSERQNHEFKMLFFF